MSILIIGGTQSQYLTIVAMIEAAETTRTNADFAPYKEKAFEIISTTAEKAK